MPDSRCYPALWQCGRSHPCRHRVRLLSLGPAAEATAQESAGTGQPLPRRRGHIRALSRIIVPGISLSIQQPDPDTSFRSLLRDRNIRVAYSDDPWPELRHRSRDQARGARQAFRDHRLATWLAPAAGPWTGGSASAETRRQRIR